MNTNCRGLLRPIASIVIVSCFLPAVVAGQQDDVFTDPMTAGLEFALQGEYVGHPDGDESLRVGAQVIALGDGRFTLKAFVNGLPGDGWSKDATAKTVEGKLNGDKVVFTINNETIELSAGSIIVYDERGERSGELRKVMRESPDLGAEPPEGATVLFDGSNADQFENGKMDGKYLAATNCSSKVLLGDHHLHIEFRTPFMPAARSQGRGNSGVYVQGRYELQVLDSFGLEGKNNECGGIYSIAEPDVNMCFPPLSWQTYDIKFTAARYADGEKTENARITVRHNGVVIHDDVELTHGTPGRHPEGPEPDALFLQDHGNPVVFRNIWVVQQ